MMSTSYGAIAPSLPPLRQQLLHPFTVGLEADEHLAVDHQRGRAPAFPCIDQLVIGVRVRLDVLALVGDALLPKELFGRPAIPSAGLVVQDDPLHWMASLFMGTGCSLEVSPLG
jgi:hypothetical protein